jgi:hypothetical protein
VGLETVLVLRDPNVQLSLIVATAEQQVLQDEGLRETRPFGEEAPPDGTGGPGSAQAVPPRCGEALWKLDRHPPECPDDTVQRVQGEASPDAHGKRCRVQE